MEYDNFYLTVKSNDNKEIHKDNGPSNFTITLKTPMILEGRWEVGLATFVLPHTWDHTVIDKVPDARLRAPVPKTFSKFDCLHVKSNLIESQLYGTEYTPIMRTIIPHGGHGIIQSFNFNPIYYFPMRVSILNNINISIYRYKNMKETIEEEIPFKGGTVVSVLHFRKKLF